MRYRTRLLLKDGSEWPVPDDLYQKLQLLYYDVDAELERMSLWCLGNPGRRKTSRGARRFVTTWFLHGGKRRPVGMPASVIAAESVGPRTKPSAAWTELVAKFKRSDTGGDR